jgi:opacity protein-like surface antigen
MRRPVLATALFLVVTAGVACAQAPTPYPVLSQVGPYLTAQLGGSFPTDDPYNNSVSVGGGIGWRFNPNLRTDATITYRPDIGPSFGPSLNNWSLMFNGYYDFNSVHLGGFVPYVKAGLGLAETSDGGTVQNFAWDAGGGLSYALSDHTAVDIDYQYISMGHTTTSLVDLNANEVKIGFRYGF